MSKILGIDLGTSNSAASVLEAGRPVIIPSAEGTTTGGGKAFPSYVAFTKDGQLIVGEPARRQAISNPEGTVTAFKRKMGTDYRYRLHGKEYTPQQLSAYLLQKIKRDAEAFLGEKIEKAVITVPAYFNDNQRQATKDAGAIAGLEVVRIINEPTAASLAYGLDKAGKNQKILVFDLGGGTLDVTIMDFGDGVFEVLSTSGDTQLGGTDMDSATTEWIASEFQKESGVDIRKDKMAMQRVRDAAEKAKIELSSTLETQINLPFLTATNEGPKHLALTLTRAKLEELVPTDRRPMPRPGRAGGQRCEDREAGHQPDRTGRRTHPHADRSEIPRERGRTADRTRRGPDGVRRDGRGDPGRRPRRRGQGRAPARRDPAVAGPRDDGWRVHAPDRSEHDDPHAQEPDVHDRLRQPIDGRDQDLPGRAADRERQRQPRELPSDRDPARPRGVPQIEVSYDLDANGLLNVSAKDLASGRKQGITITASNKLSKEDVDKMVHQAEQFADADKARAELVNARNQAESLAYEADRLLSDAKEKIDAADAESVRDKVKALRTALETKDGTVADIRSKTDDLTKVLHAVSTKLYQAGTPPPGGAATAPPEEASSSTAPENDAGPSGPVDADFKVVDKDTGNEKGQS